MIWVEEIEKPKRKRRHNLDIYSKDVGYLETILNEFGKMSPNANGNEIVKGIKNYYEANHFWWNSNNQIWDIEKVMPFYEGREWYRLRLYVFDNDKDTIVSRYDLKEIKGSKVNRAYYKEA